MKSVIDLLSFISSAGSRIRHFFTPLHPIAVHYFLAGIISLQLSTTNIFAQPHKIIVPEIPGIIVTVGESVLIPAQGSALAFQFEDGRIVVGQKEHSMWSYDGGHAWQAGPESPGEKVAIDLGNSERLM